MYREIVKPLLFIAGAMLLAFLVHRVGAEPIMRTLRALAWWQFILICLPYAVILAVDTLGWRFAFARDRAPFWRLYGATRRRSTQRRHRGRLGGRRGGQSLAGEA